MISSKRSTNLTPYTVECRSALEVWERSASTRLTDGDASRAIEGIPGDLRDTQKEVADQKTSDMVGLAAPVQDVIGGGQQAGCHEGHGKEEHGDEEPDRVQSEANVVPGGHCDIGAVEHTDTVVRVLEQMFDAEVGDYLFPRSERPVRDGKFETGRKPFDESHVRDVQILRVHFARLLLATEHCPAPTALLHSRQRVRILGSGHAHETSRDVDTVPARVRGVNIHMGYGQLERAVVEDEERRWRRLIGEIEHGLEIHGRLPWITPGHRVFLHPPVVGDGPRRIECLLCRRIHRRSPSGYPERAAIPVFRDYGAVRATIEDDDFARDVRYERSHEHSHYLCAQSHDGDWPLARAPTLSSLLRYYLPSPSPPLLNRTTVDK
ncbi:hypothetical protein J6590_059323 [Homalodisca vitripennis]|nr:hypothetical protein J6590_059323 [Homalodisca vitripennis]